MIEISYKQPYIEMFMDIRNLVKANVFSVEAISALLDTTSERIFRDSKDCTSGNNEIRKVALTAREELQKYCHRKSSL